MYWDYKDIKLNYEMYGEGIPVILLHGYGVDHRLMSGCLEGILSRDICGKNFRRIYPDLPGMGLTKATDWIKNADVMLEILMNFIKEIAGGPFILIGESYGGYLARGIIKKMPGQVLAAMFLCPVIFPDYSLRSVPEFEIFEATDNLGSSGIGDADYYTDFKESMAVQTVHTWERFNLEAVSGIKLGDSIFMEDYQKNGYSFTFDPDDTDKPYVFPALFLTGRQDSCVGYSDACSILKNYKNGSMYILNRAGHNLQIDQEEQFEMITKRWLCTEVLSCI